jgi:hypothetical protein
MKEGWNDHSYVIVFEGEEVRRATEGYGLAQFMPGYMVIGLIGWDDFIVEDKNNQRHTVPTVPLDLGNLSPFDSTLLHNLRSDPRFTGKIKWYIKPIIFGGDPNLGTNVTWIDLPSHQKAVQWWNEMYRDLGAKQRNA